MATDLYPKISVVTPSYNQGRFLEETIQSVLDQNYPNLEYIIIDGGSTDESVEIIKKYEKHLAYWVSEKDRGQSHAINKGFEKITGEIVSWVNSDDFYCRNSLSEVAEKFLSDPQLQIVFGDHIDVDERGLFLKYGRNSWFSFRALKYGQLISQPAIFFKSELLKKYGALSEKYSYCMDYELFMRFGQNTKYGYIGKPLVNFRWHSTGKSTKHYFLFAIEKREIQKLFGINIESWFYLLNEKFYRFRRRLKNIMNRNFIRAKSSITEYIKSNNLGGADVIYVCIGFSGYRMSGDKNFYVDLFDEFVKTGVKFFIISFSDPIQGAFNLEEKIHSYKILYLKRPFHLMDPQRHWRYRDGFISYRHQHGLFWEHIERVVALFYWIKLTKAIIENVRPTFVHYLDAFLYPKIRSRKWQLVLTHVSFDKKYSVLYDFYLRLLYNGVQKVILLNEDHWQSLTGRVRRITTFVVQQWGVKQGGGEMKGESIRPKIMNDPGNVLILWSGFIQQIRYKDFLYANRLAILATSLINNIEFVFAFKPEINIKLPDSHRNIHYLKTGKEFNFLLFAADVFFSPFAKKEIVATPPLTWIEAISRKKAIITTNILGVRGYFGDDGGILTFKDENEFVEIIKTVSANPDVLKDIGERAFEVYKKYFDIKLTAEAYRKIYGFK